MSPKSRSSSRDRRTAAPSDPARRTSSPADPPFAPPPPQKDGADTYPGSPPEQDCKPLKKRKGRRPRWTRVVNRTQRPAQACAADDKRLSLCKSHLTLPTPQLAPPHKPRPVGRPPNPNRVPPSVSQLFAAPPRKRGRPKTKMPRLDAPQPGRAVRAPPSKVYSLLKSKEEQDPPVLHPEVDLNLRQPMRRKRGRPKRQPPNLPQEAQPPTLALEERGGSGSTAAEGAEAEKAFRKKGNGQLIMKTIIGKINKMKTLKRKRLLSQILTVSGAVAESSRAAGGEAAGGRGSRQALPVLPGGLVREQTGPSD